jgi:GTPase Era involved in 16S rRNA processing
MSAQRLRIAVVGHTNTGKTSLVRTLTHNRAFGEVRDEGGTTRRIASGDLVADGGARIELFDSPGLENAPELIDWLDRQSGDRHDGPDRIRRMIDDPEAARRFDHEARVLELMLDVDVALYVIDAREPVLEKYQDELAVLGLCARPIVAVLNFTASPDSREAEWREALARVQLHTVLAFDAAVRDPATERALFEKLRSQLDRHAAVLSAWLDQREREETHRRRAALEAVASLLLDVAAFVREVGADNAEAQRRAWREMRDVIHRREQACLDTLLELYRFGREDYDESELPISDGRWQADLFDPETLRHYGLRTSGYAAVGAGAGAAVDVGTGGLSLGAGTLTGAALGAGAGLVRSAGSRLIARMRGRERLMVDDAVVRLLMARSLELLAALIRRGHGSPERIRTELGRALDRRRLPGSVRRARHHPNWSALNGSGGESASRSAALTDLAGELEQVRPGENDGESD